MARFYLSADNSRGSMVTAAGSSRGQACHLRGWNVGVSVNARVEDDEDVFYIYSTGGSNGGVSGDLIGRVRLVDGVPTFDTVVPA